MFTSFVFTGTQFLTLENKINNTKHPPSFTGTTHHNKLQGAQVLKPRTLRFLCIDFLAEGNYPAGINSVQHSGAVLASLPLELGHTLS